MRTRIAKKQLREFGFLLGLGFPIIIGWLIPAMSGHVFRSWSLWVGFVSLIVVILKPFLLLYPYKIWMKLGHILGWINSRIILGLVFLIVLLPIALIMRMLGHDPLKNKKLNQKSYREIKKDQKVNLKKIF